ncbi:gp34 [Bacillus phage G]|uniref:Gp34 n=1 Tax=Bacillus phage G TaxID=2884420 RepID=G3MBA4_9CAUD|nr:gp34 [Bacillus phage G]AEO93305.1 gp34 [Bacillus phage G]
MDNPVNIGEFVAGNLRGEFFKDSTCPICNSKKGVTRISLGSARYTLTCEDECVSVIFDEILNSVGDKTIKTTEHTVKIFDEKITIVNCEEIEEKKKEAWEKINYLKENDRYLAKKLAK